MSMIRDKFQPVRDYMRRTAHHAMESLARVMGPPPVEINPPPGNLALRHPSMGDPYIYWRISEGGLMEPFNSIMPGWKGLLDEEEIWQIISYVRTMIVL